MDYQVLPNEVIEVILSFNQEQWIVFRLLSKGWFYYFTGLLFSPYVCLSDQDTMVRKSIENLIQVLTKEEELFSVFFKIDQNCIQLHKENSFRRGKKNITIQESFLYPLYRSSQYKLNNPFSVGFYFDKEIKRNKYFSLVMNQWLGSNIPIKIIYLSHKKERAHFYSEGLDFCVDNFIELGDVPIVERKECDTILTIKIEKLDEWKYMCDRLSIIKNQKDTVHHFQLYSGEGKKLLQWKVMMDMEWSYISMELWFVRDDKGKYIPYQSNLPSLHFETKLNEIEGYSEPHDIFSSFSSFTEMDSVIEIKIGIPKENEKQFISIRKIQKDSCEQEFTAYL